MPSETQGHSDLDRQQFPGIKERCSEDPAWFLDRPLLGGDPEEETQSGWFIGCRIKGIDSERVIHYWLQVEHELDRGPRDTIVEMLERRASRLDQIGERPDRCQPGDREPRETEWYIVRDGQETPWDEVDRNAAGASLSDGQLAVATDGGEDA